MPKHTFYLCNVCGSEIDSDEPCFKAIEVPHPSYYLALYSSSYLYGGISDKDFHIYICKNCLPIKRFKKAEIRKRTIMDTLRSFWEEVVMG